MIPLAELKRLAAKNGIALTTVEKDYALTWILCALSKTKYKTDFIFKGGTSLRKIYFPDWRYSEDLDFTLAKPLDKEEIEAVIESINNVLIKLVGLRLAAKFFHLNQEYAQLKVQFMGPLQHENTIKFDLSFNELLVLPPQEKPILSEYSDREENSLLVYPLEEILAEKIRSILQRGKTRDYYDVWKILKEHFPQINKEKTRQVLAQKCEFKNLICNEELLFKKDKIAQATLHWEKGLAHQINALPDFTTVIKECKELLKPFLEEK